MSYETHKDVVDHLCATDPIWKDALQIVQLARRQSGESEAATRLICALMILATEEPDPRTFIAHCAEGLLTSPLGHKEH